MNHRPDSQVIVTAGELLGFRLCTGQCLLGLEDDCRCRCRGRWHAALVSAALVIPAHLTLAEALSGGPASVSVPRQSWRSGSIARRPVTATAAELHFTSCIAAGQVPSVRRIRRELHVGQDRATQIQGHLAAVTAARD